MSDDPLRIGALARLSGLSPDSLRAYERAGLLTRPPRSSGGFRLYPPQALQRVRVIQAALALGFTRAELASVFRQRAAGKAPCRQVRALAGEKLVRVDAALAELRLLRRVLHRTLGEWDARLARTPAQQPAGLLDALAAALPPGRVRPLLPGAPPRRRRATR